MNWKKQILLSSFVFSLLIIMTSCSTIKPYQRAYLDDTEMKFGADHAERFELKAFTYREGSVNIVKTKSSGGCGCN